MLPDELRAADVFTAEEPWHAGDLLATVRAEPDRCDPDSFLHAWSAGDSPLG